MTGPRPGALPRHMGARFVRALETMPVVVLMGARQTGKSTLVRDLLGDPTRSYVTLDDRHAFERARTDPDAFVLREGATGRLTIDEVQREPALLHAIKLAVDAEGQRTPGRFVLTGSANLLLMRQVTESLAGRASYLVVSPMTRREQLGFGTAGAWDDFLDAPVRDWLDIARAQPAPAEEWRDLALRGGFPRPAVHMSSDDARAEWFGAYVNTYLERDIPELAPIAHLSEFRRLMQSLALRVGTLVNQTQLARETSLPQTTLQRYLSLLETSFQLMRVPAYTATRTRRLIKTPKVYWGDPGLAMHLSGEREPRGEHLENIVAHDLLAWSQGRSARTNILYWRTTTGREVDFVIEAGTRLIPVEVKATTQPSTSDVANIKAFGDEYGAQMLGGLVLHCGSDAFWLADRVLAAPWWMVL